MSPGQVYVTLTQDEVRAAYLQAMTQALTELELGDYAGTRAIYWSAIYDAIETYLTSEQSIAAFKNDVKYAITVAYPDTADTAWSDGGGDLPIDEDVDALTQSYVAQEMANIDQLFLGLKELRKENDITQVQHEAFARADGYANTLDGFYSRVKVYAAADKMLNFVGDDGEKSCDTCQRLKDERHRASWWLAHDLIPYPGNDNFECGGWRCKHGLEDDDGHRYTI